MTDREKLIALLVKGCNSHDPCPGVDCFVCIADHLSNSGVKVQQWIPVTERLPNEDDANDDCCVLAIRKETKRRYFHWHTVANNPFDFTHWMPLPEPPKEVE